MWAAFIRENCTEAYLKPVVVNDENPLKKVQRIPMLAATQNLYKLLNELTSYN